MDGKQYSEEDKELMKFLNSKFGQEKANRLIKYSMKRVDEKNKAPDFYIPTELQ